MEYLAHSVDETSIIAADTHLWCGRYTYAEPERIAVLNRMHHL